MTRIVKFATTSFLLLVSMAMPVAGNTLQDDEQLYMQECSKCHGQVQPANARWQDDSASFKRVAFGGGVATARKSTHTRLVVALPFGPNLSGVYGRRAGSIAKFSYSDAFLDTLKDVVWERHTLDSYLTNSRDWAPGVRMYYRQPDAKTRSAIIDYLKRMSGAQ